MRIMKISLKPRPLTIFGTALVLIFLVMVDQVQAISIPEEKKLSKEFIKAIRQQHVILHDPLSKHLIDSVGKHLLASLPPQPFSYSFYLVNDGTLNAFAGPGGHIFIHRGLFTSLSSVDDLAGIMAHEISHVINRHVSQSIDRSKIVGIGSLAGVLAGALIGANGGGGQAAQVLTMGALAAGQSAMLAYTRENETEADQNALILLKQSCYDPYGLLRGLMALRESDFQGVENIPDYFKTHPGTSKRIAHISGILADNPQPGFKKPSCPDVYDFTMLKYRLMGLYGNIKKVSPLIMARLAEAPRDPAANYGMGLICVRQNRRKQAIACLQKALELRKDDPGILLELGRTHMLDGKFAKGIALLNDLQGHPVIGLQARYYIAVAQLESGKIEQAQKNLARVIELLPDTFPRAYYHMGDIMVRKNCSAMSHYYLGVYYDKVGNRKKACAHLEKALSEKLSEPYKTQAEKRLDSSSESP